MRVLLRPDRKLGYATYKFSESEVAGLRHVKRFHCILGFSIISYAGHVRLGLASDAGLVPDPEVIVEGFHAEFEELQARGQEAREV